MGCFKAIGVGEEGMEKGKEEVRRVGRKSWGSGMVMVKMEEGPRGRARNEIS